MRLGLTLQRLHGQTNFQVITGPEVPISEQLAAAKNVARALTGRVHPEIAELQVWTSSEGCRKRLKFHPPGAPATDETEAEGSEESDGCEEHAAADLELAAKAAGAEPPSSEEPAPQKSTRNRKR